MTKTPKLYRLAMWAQMPGDDFDRPWAYWMLSHDWVYSLWMFLIEAPLGWLHCKVYHHEMDVELDGSRFCPVCGTNLSPLEHVSSQIKALGELGKGEE